ncbi:MAG: ABC transporter ATP-binding protein [Actinomycetota bacterium]
MTEPIVVEGLTKVYGDHRAVDDLSFAVPWERVTGFLGPNGAGKTTTMRMILGLASIDGGRAEVLGRPYASLERPSATVGSLLETQQFHPQRSARDHLRAYAAAGSVADSRVDEVLRLVELSDVGTKKVRKFSLGMRQRLGLAAALLGDPSILVLDEPANGLDPSGIRWLRSFLRSFAAQGRAVFLSSHLLAEVAQMADDVVVINHGRLVVHADVENLVSHAERGVRVRTDQPERLRDVLAGLGNAAELVSHDVVFVKGATVEEIGRAAATAGIPLFGLNSEEENLEDVFLQLTGSEER